MLVLASDGLWDVLDHARVLHCLKNTAKSPDLIAKRLLTEALDRGSRRCPTAYPPHRLPAPPSAYPLTLRLPACPPPTYFLPAWPPTRHARTARHASSALTNRVDSHSVCLRLLAGTTDNTSVAVIFLRDF